MIDPYLYSILQEPPNIMDYTTQLMHRICKVYGLSVSELKNPDFSRYRAEAKHLYFYIVRNITRMTLYEIGDTLNRDHSSVIYGVKKVNNYIYSKDKLFLDKLTKVINQDELNKINDPILDQYVKLKSE